MNAVTGMFVKFHLYLDSLKKNEKGQAIVEYALILVLIAIVCIAALKLVGGGANNALSKVGSTLN
ncbi:MAG: Flp family type IVb pilin [Desulfuromonadales bacterium]